MNHAERLRAIAKGVRDSYNPLGGVWYPGMVVWEYSIAAALEQIALEIEGKS